MNHILRALKNHHKREAHKMKDDLRSFGKYENGSQPTKTVFRTLKDGKMIVMHYPTGVYVDFEFQEAPGIMTRERLWGQLNDSAFFMIDRTRWGMNHDTRNNYKRDKIYPVGKLVRLGKAAKKRQQELIA